MADDPSTTAATIPPVRGGHPPMPHYERGVTCPFLRDWDHFCDRGWRHEGAHHCPCGLEVSRVN